MFCPGVSSRAWQAEHAAAFPLHGSPARFAKYGRYRRYNQQEEKGNVSIRHASRTEKMPNHANARVARRMQ